MPTSNSYWKPRRMKASFLWVCVEPEYVPETVQWSQPCYSWPLDEAMSPLTLRACACLREGSCFQFGVPNAFTMFWIQLHKLWAERETVLALRLLQQHMILLHRVSPICPNRFPTLIFPVKQLRSIRSQKHCVPIGYGTPNVVLHLS